MTFPNTVAYKVSVMNLAVATNGDPVTVAVSSKSASDDFQIVKGSCARGEVPCVLSIGFAVFNTGASTGILDLTDNLTGITTYNAISLSGTGITQPVYGVAGISPDSLSYSSRPVGSYSISQAVTLSNTGAASFAISSIAFTGANAGEFNVNSTTCGTSLAKTSSCTISVQFAPTVAGSKTASLVVSGDVNAGLPLSVGITGAAY